MDRAVLGRFGRRQYLDDARPRRVGGAPAAGSSGCSGETVVTDLARHGAATIRATLAVGRPAVSLFPTSRALAVVELDSTGAATDEPWRPELGGPVNVGEIAGDAVIALPNHPSSRAFLVHGLTAREAVPQTTEVGLVSDSVERPSEALLREDGSAIVAGGVNDEAMVVSLLTDGRPNPAFGRDGVARWHHGPADVLHLNGVSGDRPSTMRRDSATIPS